MATPILAAVFAVAGATMILIGQDNPRQAPEPLSCPYSFLPTTDVEAFPGWPAPQDGGPARQQIERANPQTRRFLPAITKRRSGRSPEQVAPGIYEAKPYTMIVVVPGPQPDDRCIVGAGKELKMPAKKPGLRLEPRKPK